MSKPSNQQKQTLTLSDVAAQIIALSTSSKEGLGNILTGTLYEALSSTLVELESQPEPRKITGVILTNKEATAQPDSSSIVEISVQFLSIIVSAGPTWPTTLLISRLLSHIPHDSKQVHTYSLVLKSLIKALGAKEVMSVKIAALECLSVLFKSPSLAYCDVFRSNDLHDALFKIVKYTSNTSPQAQLRTSLFHCLQNLIVGVNFGPNLPQLNERLIKLMKYWASCTEKSLAVRAAAFKTLAVWSPYAASSTLASICIQQILQKELPTNVGAGYAYGMFLYSALKESVAPEAIPPPKPGVPPPIPGSQLPDSAGILAIKEYDSFTSILEHLTSLWTRNATKKDCREGLTACIITLFTNTSLKFIEKKLSIIIRFIVQLCSSPVSKQYGSDMEEVKSSLSYILRAGVIHKSTEEGKRLIFNELIALLSATNWSTPLVDPQRASFILAEVYSMFTNLGESVTRGSEGSMDTTIPDLMFQIIQQQQEQIALPAHRSVFASIQSPTNDGNGIWIWAGFILKRYAVVNDQFFIPIDKFHSLLPSPAGTAAATTDPLPASWAYACTKRSRPASSAEFGAVLQICQYLLNQDAVQNSSPNWCIAGWILLSSMLLRGTGQSAEQDRASMVSAHLVTLQHLWKQELSKRPPSDADLADFAFSKLWLVYSLKHFLSNFSKLVHEANLTTFITQCLNTVLKAITSWQSTGQVPKSERDSAAIDALIVAVIQSYTTLATHIFNPPTSLSPRLNPEVQTPAPASFPARSVLQMIAKQIVRTRYTTGANLAMKYLHPEDDALEANSIPYAGAMPLPSRVYEDFHSVVMNIASSSQLLWSEWSWTTERQSTSKQLQVGGIPVLPSQPQRTIQAIETAISYLPISHQLMTEMIALFPPLYHQQQTQHQIQLLQYLTQAAIAMSSHAAPIHANILYILLAVVKENAKLSGHQLGAMMSAVTTNSSKPLAKEILSSVMAFAHTYSASPFPGLRRLAAEIIAFSVDSDEASLLGSTIKSFQQSLNSIVGPSGTQATQIVSKLSKEEATVCGAMVILGSIHRAVGGIRSRQYLPETIKTLNNIVRATFDSRPAPGSTTPAPQAQINIHQAALHSLWNVLETTGLTDTSFAPTTLGLMLDALISDISRDWNTGACMGRIVAAIAQALGPELQVSSALLRRLQGVIILLDCIGQVEIEDIYVSYNNPTGLAPSDWVVPRSGAPVRLSFDSAIILRERLLLFAPQFMDPTKNRSNLLRYVLSAKRLTDFDDGSSDIFTWSPITKMRLNALRVLKFLAQLNPQVFQDDELVKKIILCTDVELKDSMVLGDCHMLITTLEETLVPLDPLKWLFYASQFVLGTESKEGAISSSSNSLPPSSQQKSNAKSLPPKPSQSTSKFSNRNGDDDEDKEEEKDEAEEEIGSLNTMSVPVIESISSTDDEAAWKLSSNLTSLFVSSIQYVFYPLASKSAHFNALEAEKQRATTPSAKFLVDELQRLVALAAKASSSPTAIQQISGLEAIHCILASFAESGDPQLENHYLLELYVAQMSAALRKCIDRRSSVANRVCHAAYVVLAEMILWISSHVSDVAALRQLIRPFLDPSLEKKSLHHQSMGTNSVEMEYDSPIGLELNPRYVAWLFASAILWEGAGALTSCSASLRSIHDSDNKRSQQEEELRFLQKSLKEDQKLKASLHSGWMAILRYRAVQQYSQDLIQQTLFGTSQQSQKSADAILDRSTNVGMTWCRVLIAMCNQFAEYAQESTATEQSVSSASKIIFGLILHNFSSVVHLNETLIALDKFLQSLRTLHSAPPQSDHQILPGSSSWIRLSVTSITELSQALYNLLGVIPYHDYSLKARLLQTIASFVSTISIRSISQDIIIRGGEGTLFKDEGVKAANELLVNVLLESLETGQNSDPSLRHPLSYINALLKSLSTAWPLLISSKQQQSILAIWMVKLSTFSIPELNMVQFQRLVLDELLSCWSIFIKHLDSDQLHNTVAHLIQSINQRTSSADTKTELDLSLQWMVHALIQSGAGFDTSSQLSWLDKILSTVTLEDVSKAAPALTVLREFIQRSLANPASRALGHAYVVIAFPYIWKLVNIHPMDFTSRTSTERRSEFLKFILLLHSVPGTNASHRSLIIQSLVSLLALQPSDIPPSYSTLHDSVLQVLLHLAQTQSDLFREAFTSLSTQQRSLFETAVRANTEKIQAQQAFAQAGKVKFSLDTSKYSKA